MSEKRTQTSDMSRLADIPKSTQSLTPSQREAIEALEANGGEGVIDQRGRLMARGEILLNSKKEPFNPATWLRLLTFGFLEVAGPYRLRVKASR